MWIKIFFVHIIIHVLCLFPIQPMSYVPIHKTKEWITSMKINARNSKIKINLLILYHLLDRVIFVSHYIDDSVIARTCCDISYHVECSWNEWMWMNVKNLVTWHIYYLAMSHLYQIALMISSCRDMSNDFGAKRKKGERRRQQREKDNK